MHDLFTKPTARFLAGFVLASFFLLPVLWILLGFPESVWLFLASMAVVGIAGGIFFVRRPPAILYQPPPEVHGAGVFNKPVARFLAGFALGCLTFLPVAWIISGPFGLDILPPMVGAGIAVGGMWIRRPPPFLTKRAAKS